MARLRLKMPPELEKVLTERYALMVERQNLPGRQAVRALEGMLNRATRRFYRRLRRMRPVDFTPRTVAVNRLTNWQRNQWARGGYRKLPDAIEFYARMVHP